MQRYALREFECNIDNLHLFSNAGFSDNMIKGVDARMELAMLAQHLDVLPPMVAFEREIDSDDDFASVIGL